MPPNMPPKANHKPVLEATFFFMSLVQLSVAIGVVAMLLPLEIIEVGLSLIWYSQLGFIALYAFIHSVYFLFRKKLDRNEGFFFMGAIFFKLLVVFSLMLSIDKGWLSQNHGTVFFVMCCYGLYLTYYTVWFVRMLNKQ
jgi:hypothetical protein